jgi:perosamine synthetase
MKRNIPVAEPDLTGNEAKYVMEAIETEKRVSSSGKYVDLFEKDIADYCCRKYALTTSSGTTALHLALLALGIRQGDEVIVPTFTFAASVAVVAHTGAVPIFIDSKMSDWNIDETKLNALKTPQTRAIIAVDIYGIPANYKVLEAWCKKNNIFLIEDAAESLGGSHHGRKAGSFGDISCLSFYGNKNITTGEGGMCLTDNPDLNEKMRVFRNHGMKQAGLYDHMVIGYNYRMTNVQAAIGCAQFERFPVFLKKRKAHEKLYRSLLKDLPGVRFQEPDDATESAHWMISILIDKDVAYVREKLKEQGIETRSLFKPLHLQPGYQHFVQDKKYKNADMLHQQGLNLPSSPLLTPQDIRYVCKKLKGILKTM